MSAEPMLIRVRLQLRCPSEADAITVRDAMAQKIATKPQRVVHSAVTSVAVQGGQWLVVSDVSFQTRAEANDIYTDVQAKWASVALRNRILIGSKVTLHICPHAEGEPPPWQSCRDIDYQLAEKV